MLARIEIDEAWIAAFCQKWQITEFALFGSVLRDDFRADSDVDVLLTFSEDARWSLWDLVTMQDELKEHFGRDADILTKKSIKNPYRRRQILSSYEVIHAA